VENNKNQIVFNRPFVTGDEPLYISKAVLKGKLSGNGEFTKLCQQFFEKRYGIPKCLLTTSGTDALEMAALLLNIQPGDEVIVPSFTFVSTANAFALRGAKIVFADVDENIPNITLAEIRKLVSSKTKAIVVVHYAGFGGEIDQIVKYAKSKGIYIIEDAALAVESKYQNKYLGTFGDLAAFSFHETKNVISGEGGMLAINNPEFIERAEIIWEKGTNRAAFSRGKSVNMDGKI
jgi:dTDP-4-amino-4,6-dideoxygalactose transaminase